MKEKILKILRETEIFKNVEIIFAVESGSRSWGFESANSDYDVRGVFVRPVKDYVGLENKSDQINLVIDDIDIELWDVRKFCKLLISSNPQVGEWLNSEIIYKDSDYLNHFREIFKAGFSAYKLKKHYVSMARSNYEKYIRGQISCSLKKYAYVLRAIACVDFLEQYEIVPPIRWNRVASMMHDAEACSFFLEVVEMKQSGEEVKGPQNESVNRYIESYFTKKFDESEDTMSEEQVEHILLKIIMG